MLYFANPVSDAVVAAMRDGRLGLIDTPTQRKPMRVAQAHAAEAVWCADNGCFGSEYPGDQAWFDWLRSRAGLAATCRFATAPDVVGDAAATLERSAPWLEPIRSLGFPAALVAQDGLTEADVPWSKVDAIFLGGSTDWKKGPAARRIARAAKARGAWLHMGRVNSGKRWRYAEDIGCDSADGTFLVFGGDHNLSRMQAWPRPAGQHPLFPITDVVEGATP